MQKHLRVENKQKIKIDPTTLTENIKVSEEKTWQRPVPKLMTIFQDKLYHQAEKIEELV